MSPGAASRFHRRVLKTLERPGLRFEVLLDECPHGHGRTIVNERHSITRVLSKNGGGEACRDAPDTASAAIGEIVFLPANMPIHVQGEGGRLRLARLEFDTDRFPAVSEAVGALAGCDLSNFVDMRDEAIARCLQALVFETETPNVAADLYIDGIAQVIAASLTRRLQAVALAQPDHTTAPLNIAHDPVYDYIVEHLSERIRVADIAAVCGVSERQVARIFLAETGLTVHDYIERTRIDYAKRLLAARDLPIKGVAHRVGYSGQSSFTTVFRRATGHTPFAYRRFLWTSGLHKPVPSERPAFTD